MKDSWADIYFLCRDEASDHVEVYVENTKETVETTAKLLLYRLHMIISLHKETETKSPLLGSGSLPTTFPSPCTLQMVLARYTDQSNPTCEVCNQIFLYSKLN